MDAEIHADQDERLVVEVVDGNAKTHTVTFSHPFPEKVASFDETPPVADHDHPYAEKPEARSGKEARIIQRVPHYARKYAHEHTDHALIVDELGEVTAETLVSVIENASPEQLVTDLEMGFQVIMGLAQELQSRPYHVNGILTFGIELDDGEIVGETKPYVGIEERSEFRIASEGEVEEADVAISYPLEYVSTDPDDIYRVLLSVAENQRDIARDYEKCVDVAIDADHNQDLWEKQQTPMF
jgi:hypothetical protein